MSLVFAATYPQRTTHLVLIGAFARRIRTDDYPWAPTAEERERLAETIEHEWPYVPGEVLVSSTARCTSHSPSWRSRIL
jgi:pimeloyl-ACP methyl ester carboxylesterase